MCVHQCMYICMYVSVFLHECICVYVADSMCIPVYIVWGDSVVEFVGVSCGLYCEKVSCVIQSPV